MIAMHRTRTSHAALLILLVALVSSASAQPVAPVGPAAPVDPASERLAAAMKPVLDQRLDLFLELLNGRREREDELVFTEEVLQARPLEAILAEIRQAAESSDGFEVLERRQLGRNLIGAWLRAKRDRRALRILKIGVEISPSRRIEEFSLLPTTGPREDPGAAWRVFDELVGAFQFRVGCFAGEVSPDGTVTESHSTSGDDRLAVGTLGMIWAHLALADWITEGGASWNDPLMIDESLRCLPDSRTSVLPAGESLSLMVHANRALVDSDNTAAEHLVAMLGRLRVERARDQVRVAAGRGGERAQPTDGEPFLSPAEMYRLKCGVTDLVNRYAAATNADRRAMLDNEVPESQVDAALFLGWNKPQQLERVGWHASPRELCVALARLWGRCKVGGECKSISLLSSRRPDAHAQEGCVSVALKGGEPGAIAAAWLRERPDGRVMVMAVIVNDPKRPVPADDSAAIVVRALDALSKTP